MQLMRFDESDEHPPYNAHPVDATHTDASEVAGEAPAEADGDVGGDVQVQPCPSILDHDRYVYTYT